MTPAPAGRHLWIIGAGRMGLAVGGLLHQSGSAGAITVSTRRPGPPRHPLFLGDPAPARFQPALLFPDPQPTHVLLAVPDAAIAEVVDRIARTGITPETPVLHLSGVLGLDVLAPLVRVGCSVGSLHPLAAVPAGETGVDRLRGAWFTVEGEGGARTFAEEIVGAAGGHLLPIRTGDKPLYHAAAVFASNYVVVLLAAAERMMVRAGIPPEPARAALAELARGAASNVELAGAAAALTGPVARGDAETVRLHLSRLSGRDHSLYSVLARQALSLARERGIDAALAEEIEQLLGDDA